MAGATAHAGLPRHPTENRRRAEGQIAEIDHIRLAAGNFRPEHFARLVERILVEFGFRRQGRLIAVDRKRHGTPVEACDQESKREAGDP